MVKKPSRITALAQYQIPASFAREVGRIIVRCAYLEHSVRRLGWDLLGIDARLGRVAVRDPRLEDYVDMLTDIAFLKKIALNTSKISSLKIRGNDVVRWRDLVAHGIWIPQGERWLIQMTSGNYPKDYQAEHRKRRINPEGINVDLNGLISVSDGIEMLIEEVLTMRSDLEPQLRPSRDKDHEPSKLDHLPRDRD